MDESDEADYRVGYKKPPRHAQFKPGHSGNVRGRPKRSTAPTDVVRRQVRKIVSVNIGGKTQKVSMLEAIAMKQISQAASGDHKSTALVFGALKPNETDQDNNLPELLRQFRAIHAAQAGEKRVSPPSLDDNREEEDSRACDTT